MCSHLVLQRVRHLWARSHDALASAGLCQHAVVLQQCRLEFQFQQSGLKVLENALVSRTLGSATRRGPSLACTAGTQHM